VLSWMQSLLKKPHVTLISVGCVSIAACVDNSHHDGNSAPLLKLDLSRAQSDYNQTIQLSWRAPGASECAIPELVSTNLSPAGKLEIGPLVSDQSFSMSCVGDGGIVTESIQIKVAEPQLELDAAQLEVEQGSATLIAWNSNLNGTCRAESTPEGVWAGSVDASGLVSTVPLSEDTRLKISCHDGLHALEKEIQIVVVSPKPRILLTADRSEVPFSEEVTISWEATQAHSCVAQGDWLGGKNLKGNWTTRIYNAEKFILVCEGAGGSVEKAVEVAVSASASPQIQLTASAEEVDWDGVITLQWSGQNIESCLAEGDWEGKKGVLGIETISAIRENKYFALRCQKEGKEIVVEKKIFVANRGGVTGKVDSSLLSLENREEIQIFEGVGYDEMSMSLSQPLATAKLAADACEWSFQVKDLQDGDYTLALYDPKEQRYPRFMEFSVSQGTANVVLPAHRVLRVGEGEEFSSLLTAVEAAVEGDVIEVMAGVYYDEFIQSALNHLTLRGVGGLAHVTPKDYRLGKSSEILDDDPHQAMWTLNGNDVRIENLGFAGAISQDKNGVGLRLKGRDSHVCNGYFYDNDIGVVAEAGHTQIRFSEFDANGQSGNPQASQLWVGGDRLTLVGNYFHTPLRGDQIRSYAMDNEINYNMILDGDRGGATMNVALPYAGKAVLMGNVLQKSEQSGSDIFVAFGEQQVDSTAENRLFFVNNTVVSAKSDAIVVFAQEGTEAVIQNSIFSGQGMWLEGEGNVENNLVVEPYQFLDAQNYDFRLVSGLNGLVRREELEAQTSPETHLTPFWQYEHCCSVRRRVSAASPGAFAQP